MWFRQIFGSFFFAYDDGTCAIRPGLIDKKGKLLKIFSICITDIWSRKIKEAKYKKRNAKKN